MNFCLEVLSEPMVQGGGAPGGLTELRRQGLKFIEDEMEFAGYLTGKDQFI